ncbi:MAG: HlyD family secretion protein [Peptococcaceae bacterium]
MFNKSTQIRGMVFWLLLAGAGFLAVGCDSGERQAAAAGSNLHFTGTVEAKEVDVSSKIPGRIIELHVQEGMEVKEGTLLFEIDPADLEVKKLQAEAGVKAAEAQLNKAVNGARKQQIAQAKAVLGQAEAQVELLQKKYERLLPLYEAEALPQDQLDEVATKLDVARLQAEAAVEQYDLVLEGAQAEDIKALEAQYAGARAKLQEVLINLEETEVVAPGKGSVSMLIAEKGELVGSGMPVITITDYRDSWVEINVKETEMGQVRLGQKAELQSKAYPDYIFQGEVISINKNPDFAISKSTNELNEKDIISYAVKIKINDTAKQLYPGMLLEVTLPGNEG